MDIKEWGLGGVVLVGGAMYGISQFGLNDVLSEDLSYISDVTRQERPAYMASIVSEFSEAFETYSVESETYIFVGQSKFSTSPSNGTFVEVVTQEKPVPSEEVKGLKSAMHTADFCAQEEMTMFTEKGWSYRFKMKDSKGRQIFAITCRASEPKLRGMS